ncbi:MAG: tetratricopeptide repeat protein [Candidatus Eisenbacteria bacterium]
MSRKLCLAVAALITLTLVIGCGGRAVKRAPVEDVTRDLDPDTRVEMLEQLAVNFPDDANVYYELGNTFYEQALPNDARRNYEKALGLDPEMNPARVNLAMLLAESDEVDSAKVLLREALEINPNDAKAYTNLGVVYYTEMNVDAAVKQFTKALEIEPDNLEAHYNLGLAFAESGLLVEAITEWRLIVELDETSETAERARLSLDRAERDLKK